MPPRKIQSRCWLFTLPGCSDMALPYTLHDTSKFASWYLTPEGIKGFVQYNSSRIIPSRSFKGCNPQWEPTQAKAYDSFSQGRDMKSIGKRTFIKQAVKRPTTGYSRVFPDTDTDKLPINNTIIEVYYDPATGNITERIREDK